MHFLRESPAGNGRVNTYGLGTCNMVKIVGIHGKVLSEGILV